MSKSLITKITIILAIFVSQNTKSQNLIQADEKPIHFGFTLGINTMDFGIKTTTEPVKGVIYEAELSTLSPGFSVGVIGDLRLGEYFNLRLIPALHLSQRDLYYYNNVNDAAEIQNIKTNLFTIPLYLKYSSVRVKNYRPYLIAGGGIALDFGREREKPLLLKQMDYFIDFGVGCTFYFQYFRFSPEIKFALGFNNISTPLEERPNDYVAEENKKFTQALTQLTSRLFTLVFNFE